MTMGHEVEQRCSLVWEIVTVGEADSWSQARMNSSFILTWYFHGGDWRNRAHARSRRIAPGLNMLAQSGTDVGLLKVLSLPLILTMDM